MARIDALDPGDGAIVRRAAVLGLSFHPRRLADVLAPDIPLPDERFWDRLSTVFDRERDGHVTLPAPGASGGGVLEPSVQAAARASTSRSGCRLEREQGGELDADPAVLSNHFALAGDYVRAHRYAMLAAERATERFSHADAARLYQRAIEAGRASGAADATVLAEAWEQHGRGAAVAWGSPRRPAGP